RACFNSPATDTILIEATQSDSSARLHLLSVAETTVWANWFFIGGTYSSFSLLRNTTDADVHALITWRSDAGAVIGTESVTLPARGVVFRDARARTDGSAATGSVEVAHDGEPEA